MSTKTAAGVTAILLVAAGGIATQQAQAGRQAESRLTLLESENAALAARIQISPAQLGAGNSVVGVGLVDSSKSASKNSSEVAQRLGTGGLASVEESNAFLRANPEVRAELANYYRHTFTEENAELMAALGLTAAERAQFVAILANNRRTIVGEHQFQLSEDGFNGAEATRQLRELLGETRYQQYRDFNRASLQRNLAKEMTRALYFTPTPFTAGNSQALQQIVARAVADPALGGSSSGGWLHMSQPLWDRVLSDAETALLPGQLEALRELEQRSHFQRAFGEARRAERAAASPANEAPRK